MPKATGNQYSAYSNGTSKQKLEDMGISWDQSSKWQKRYEMADRINLIMQEIERIVTAKLDDGQTVEDLEKDFDKLVLECLPALVSRNRQVETLPPLPCPPYTTSHEVCRVDTGVLSRQ